MHAGEVHRLVHVTARGRALAEKRDRDILVLLHLELERRANRDRQRGPQHRGRAEDTVFEIAAMKPRVFAAREAVFLGHQLRHQATWIGPAHQEDAEIAMQRRDEIARLQWRADAVTMASWPAPE